MIKRVLVENYQDHERTELDFGQVNVLVGKGNSGKSAIMRAISAVLHNESGDDFIRQGAKSCDVTLDLDDHMVSWHKERGKGGVYSLDGQVFSRTRGAVPEPVAEALGIRELEIDQNSSLTPQVQGQFDGPFIVGETGSRVARILGKLTKLDVIVTAQMKCKNALQGHKRAAEGAAEEASRLEERLSALPDVDTARARANELAAKFHSVEQMDYTLEQAEAAANTLEKALAALNPRKLLKDIILVKEALALLEHRESAVDAYRLACDKAVNAGQAEEEAIRVANVSHAEHEKAVKEVGLCPTCPFR